MSEGLCGVSLGYSKNYNGRDQSGRIKLTVAGDGRLMTKACAEALCRVLKSKHPNVRVVELLRGERDELAAESLSDLNEASGIADLTQAVKQCIGEGVSRQEILAVVTTVVQG